jgi:hypothetical protein
MGNCISQACKTACVGVRISGAYARQAVQLWNQPEGQQGGLPQAHRTDKLTLDKKANFGPARKADKEAYHKAHQTAGNTSARHVIRMRVETHNLVPLMTTKLIWPTTRLTGRPTTGNVKLGSSVNDTGYGNNAILEMNMKGERHRNRLDVWTNKVIQSGKTVGVSAPADVNDNYNAIYGNNNAGYGDEAGHKDPAYQGQ